MSKSRQTKAAAAPRKNATAASQAKPPRRRPVVARQKAFLAAFRASANITAAAKAARIDRRAHYFWLDTYPAYARAFETADRLVAQRLEDEAVRRALHGVNKPVFYCGEKCGEIREYSDALLMFLLKARRPERFREHFTAEVSGSITVETLAARLAAGRQRLTHGDAPTEPR